MKRLFIILILIIATVSLIKINAQKDLNITDLSDPMYDKLRSLGVEFQNSTLAELEPNELFKNFDDFRKEEIAYQQKYVYIWNTFKKGYVDKLEIYAEASSSFPGYPVTNILDKKIETAWVEGVKGDGVGEWISLDIHTEKEYSPSSITLFGIISGYLKSDKSWEENNRIKIALLVIKTIGSSNKEDHYAILRLKLKDFKGLQVFNVNEYQEFDSFDKKGWLIIEDVYKGTKYTDTCISEIYLRGGCQPPDE